MVLQFLAAGIVAANGIGVIIEDDKAGNVMRVTHTDNDQRMVAHIRSRSGNPLS